MESSPPGQVGGEGDIAKLFRSYIVSSLPEWPNPGRHLVSLNYLDSIDGGLPTNIHERATALRMQNTENKSFCWGISVNSALQLPPARHYGTPGSPFSRRAN